MLFPFILGAPTNTLEKRQGQYFAIVQYNSGAWLKLNGIYSTIDSACNWYRGQGIGRGRSVTFSIDSASDPSRTRVDFKLENPSNSPGPISINRDHCIHWFRTIQDRTAVIRDGVRQSRGGYARWEEIGQWAVIATFDPNTK